MASSARRLSDNVAGDFFVDETCIDCGACRWIAPATFDARGDHARVHTQPHDAAESRRALQALVCCPTGSIGTEARHELAPITASYPERVTGGVYHAGFHDERSFGAASYLVVRERGNVLVDVPRFHRGLARRIRNLGGARYMFLTHCDDVAQHERWTAELGCQRIMHGRDVRPATRQVEIQLDGDDPHSLDTDLLVIPTPGHTRGSACLLFREEVLFSGDHLAFSRARGCVTAFSDACWFDWTVQIRSMERLAEHDFERVLPGHGAPCVFPRDEMRRQMQECIAWMRRAR